MKIQSLYSRPEDAPKKRKNPDAVRPAPSPLGLAALGVGGGGSSSSGSSGITVGTTTVTSGTDTKVLFNNAGVLGEYTITGTGSVAMSDTPTFTTRIVSPAIGTAGATTFTIRSNGTDRWDINSSGHMLAATDNTYDIGASGANRPRNVHVAGTVTASGASIGFDASVGAVRVHNDAGYFLGQRGILKSPNDGVWTLLDNANTSFGRLQFGGTSASFGAIGRDGAGIKIVGADGTSVSWIKVPGVTVANLPAAATAGAGARSFVTDALTPVFGNTVTGGGAVKVPVYSDGTNWIVG